MTRKHYVALAESIRHIDDIDARKAAAQAVADVCKRDNAAFDRARFFVACGV